jgi:curved DNA-binding protein CbpA
VTTPYDVLEVHPRASDAVIRAAYRCLVQRHHPDRSPGDAAAGERLSLINRAYALLADPLRRARYDRSVGLAAFDQRSGRALAPAKPLSESGAAPMRPFVFRKFA